MTNKRNTNLKPVSNDESWSLSDCTGYAYIGIRNTDGTTQHVLVEYLDANLEWVTVKHRGNTYQLQLATFDWGHRMPIVDIRTLVPYEINELCYMPY